MENPLSSSGIFSKDLRHWKSTRESRKICKIKTSSLTHLKIELSSCRCSMTLNGQGEEMQINVFQIPSKSRTTRRGSRKGTGHSLDLGVNWNGIELKVGILLHPVFKIISALARGILKRNNNRETIHFTADASNTKLFFRTIHSANQLSIHGAVASWCEEFGLKPDETSEKLTKTENDQILKEVRPQEVNVLVQTPRNDDHRNWKQIARMLSELRDTGKRNPIYENLWECDIQPLSFCAKMLQNSGRCGRFWWFWRSNSSMQESTRTLVRTRIPDSLLLFGNEQ